MQIKTSQYVDESGRVYLPYLHDWNRNSSDLIGVIQVEDMLEAWVNRNESLYDHFERFSHFENFICEFRIKIG